MSRSVKKSTATRVPHPTGFLTPLTVQERSTIVPPRIAGVRERSHHLVFTWRALNMEATPKDNV